MTSDTKMLGMRIESTVILSLALVDGLPKNLNKLKWFYFFKKTQGVFLEGFAKGL